MTNYEIYSSKYFGIKPEPVNYKYIKIDEKMQLGYKQLYENNCSDAVDTWKGVWNEIMDAMKKESIRTFEHFDQVFKGNQFVANWISDFDNCLLDIISNTQNKSILDVYGEMRIFLNENMQVCLKSDDILTLENSQRAIAETYFIIGNTELGEKLFEQLLNENPRWGWGWIGWSDQYWLCKGEKADFKKGEELLVKALNIKNVNDRSYIEERLLELYNESGEHEKLQALEGRLKQEDAITEFISTTKKKIGRNDPCPCGSGKKFKRCCIEK